MARDSRSGVAAFGPSGSSGQWRRPRILLLACGVAVLLFISGFGVFANYIRLLSPPTDLRAADAIIVLTGGQSRLNVALDLLKSGKGKRLLISGVNPVAGRTTLRRVTGGDQKLFSCCVDIDHVALDTVGNAEESAKWVKQHAYGSVILVTNNYHMPRSLLEMRRLLNGMDVQAYPVVNSRPEDGSWLTRPRVMRVLLEEYTKYLAALARSAVTDAFPDPTLTVARADD